MYRKHRTCRRQQHLAHRGHPHVCPRLRHEVWLHCSTHQSETMRRHSHWLIPHHDVCAQLVGQGLRPAYTCGVHELLQHSGTLQETSDALAVDVAIWARQSQGHASSLANGMTQALCQTMAVGATVPWWGSARPEWDGINHWWGGDPGVPPWSARTHLYAKRATCGV